MRPGRHFWSSEEENAPGLGVFELCGFAGQIVVLASREQCLARLGLHAGEHRDLSRVSGCRIIDAEGECRRVDRRNQRHHPWLSRHGRAECLQPEGKRHGRRTCIQRSHCWCFVFARLHALDRRHGDVARPCANADAWSTHFDADRAIRAVHGRITRRVRQHVIRAAILVDAHEGAGEIVRVADVLSAGGVGELRESVGWTVQELVELPGVGRKTANVITSVIDQQPNMAVDTHVFRVSARIGLTSNAKTPLETEKQLLKYLPVGLVHKAHHWLILHGRYICVARNPKCHECGIRPVCRYYAALKRI